MLGKPTGLLPSGKFRGTEEERIEWLARKVRGTYRKFLPSVVAIEGPAYASNMKGVAPRMKLLGVVENWLFRQEAIFLEVQPTALKKAATGNGRASKLDMIMAAKEYWKECFNDDEADAFHLARLSYDDYDVLIDPVDEDDEI